MSINKGAHSMTRNRLLVVWIAATFVLPTAQTALAQGVTTATIVARVRDAAGNPRPDVRITAVHQPSGTSYQGRTRDEGRATIPGMRIGGPYTVTASSIGYESQTQNNI